MPNEDSYVPSWIYGVRLEKTTGPDSEALRKALKEALAAGWLVYAISAGRVFWTSNPEELEDPVTLLWEEHTSDMVSLGTYTLFLGWSGRSLPTNAVSDLVRIVQPIERMETLDAQ